MLIFYTPDNVMSYAMMRLKSDFLIRYNQPSHPWHEGERELRFSVRKGGKNYRLVIKGGAWWRHVEIYKAERDGKKRLVKKLQAEVDRDLGKIMKSIRSKHTSGHQGKKNR